MKSLVKSGMWMVAALAVTALASVTVAAEDPDGNLQGSWNDYPSKTIGTSEIPTATPAFGTPSAPVPHQGIPPQTGGPPPAELQNPRVPGGQPPITWGPPRQQQQGKPGGGFAWGGGKTGGKQGGSSWGKTRPPQSQQGATPGRVPGGGQANPSEAQLIEYIRALQAQNAQLRALLERLAGQQGNGDGRSPDLPNGGVPLQ